MWGGVALVWREATGWQVDNTARFVPKVVSFLLTSWSRQWYAVGAYVPPNDRPSVHLVEQALRVAPKGLEMILMSDLNTRLGNPHNKHEEDLATALADWCLVNITYHFLSMRRYRRAGVWMWIMQRDGRRGAGKGGCILSTERSNFVNAGLQETQHGIDHRLILAMIRVEGALCNHHCR